MIRVVIKRGSEEAVVVVNVAVVEIVVNIVVFIAYVAVIVLIVCRVICYIIKQRRRFWKEATARVYVGERE